MKKKFTATFLAISIFLFATGCATQHKVETVHKVEVAPMHITIDVNVKVDKALDDFFGDLDAAEENIPQPTGEGQQPSG
jgi:hypothetical protein